MFRNYLQKITVKSFYSGRKGYAGRKAGLFILPAAVFLWVLFSTGVPLTSPAGWEKPFKLIPARISLSNFDAFSKGNFAVIAFEGKEKGRRSIYSSTSLSGGNSFFEPKLIASYAEREGFPNMNPRVAISSNGKIFIVWQSYSDEENSYRIFYSFSSDYGGTFMPPEKLIFKTEMDFIPLIFYDDKNELHVIYHSYENEQFNLYQSIAGSDLNFSAAEKITVLGKDFRGAFFPSIASSGADVLIAWQGKSSKSGILNDDIFIMRSIDYGKTYSGFENITNSSGNDSRPSLLLSGGKVYCFFQNNDGGNWKINYSFMDESGKFTSPAVVFDTNANCYYPSASAGGENIYAFFYDARGGKNSVSSVKISSDGKISEPVKLSEGRNPASNPRSLSFGSRILALWNEGGSVYGKFSDTNAEIPFVYSATHPQNKWTRLSSAQIRWNAPEDESGIEGYALTVNRERYFNPTVVNVGANTRYYEIPFLEDGITYFHIRTVDKAGNYSRTLSYPLMVSRTQLPMPAVESKTHPEGQGMPLSSGSLNWNIDDDVRVKGYYYSIAKDRPSPPKTFTENTEVSFSDLEEGRHFFSVKAVDKTDMPGKVALYEIIIGSASKLLPSEYKNIAKVKDDSVIVIKDIPSIITRTFEKAITLEYTVNPGIHSVDIRIVSKEMNDGLFELTLKKNNSEAVYRNDSGEFKIENLPAGEYSFIASALKDGKIIKRRDGVFSVGDYSGPEQAESFSAFDLFVSVVQKRFIAAIIFIPVFTLLMLFGIGRVRFLFEFKKFIFVWKNFIKVIMYKE
ncbi:MAG: hypothetical protein KA015_01615 [Spirochaetes bacterium]|nr:hypothetical protein [Spirochaetota bacterium]